MFTDRRCWLLALQIALASLVGVVVALPAFYVCLELAGGGEGTIIPFYVYFGPVWLAANVAEANSAGEHAEVWWLIQGIIGLYGVYGGILAFARSRGAGLWVLAVLLSLHYAAVLAMKGYPRAGCFSDMPYTFAKLSVVWSVTTVELLAVLHVLAFQYVRSVPPYRPHWNWRVAVTLVVGLVVGIALYAWSISMAERLAH